jgi:aminoglycoside phosphotransferase (APT) family kinase protein
MGPRVCSWRVQTKNAGRILAAIGQVTFPAGGWLGPGPRVTAPLLEGVHALPRFVDLCLASANARERLPEKLRDQTSALAWSYAPRLASLDNEARLVHCDFGGRNLLVRNVRDVWSVAAVLDWEFAVAGSRLIDIRPLPALRSLLSAQARAALF